MPTAYELGFGPSSPHGEVVRDLAGRQTLTPVPHPMAGAKMPHAGYVCLDDRQSFLMGNLGNDVVPQSGPGSGAP